MTQDFIELDGVALEAAGVEAQARALQDSCAGSGDDSEAESLARNAQRLEQEVRRLQEAVAAAAFAEELELSGLQQAAAAVERQASALENRTREQEAIWASEGPDAAADAETTLKTETAAGQAGRTSPPPRRKAGNRKKSGRTP